MLIWLSNGIIYIWTKKMFERKHKHRRENKIKHERPEGIEHNYLIIFHLHFNACAAVNSAKENYRRIFFDPVSLLFQARVIQYRLLDDLFSLQKRMRAINVWKFESLLIYGSLLRIYNIFFWRFQGLLRDFYYVLFTNLSDKKTFLNTAHFKFNDVFNTLCIVFRNCE